MAGTKAQWNETEKRGYFLGALWTTFDVKPEKRRHKNIFAVSLYVAETPYP